MRRPWREAALSIGTMIVLLLVLVAADDGVRDQVSMRVAAPSVGLSDASRHVQNLTAVVAEAARHQSLAHAPLLMFSLVATVLFLFMLRT